ncbi:transposase [Mycobacteroides abscessus subsp. abscessus]|nr:transposase [Mycobacteroides abscessus subsp. abscessus]
MTVPDGSQETMRAKARVCAVTNKLRESFGRTFEVLCDQEAFTALMVGAKLAIRSCETRINPNGTTTELTTLNRPGSAGGSGYWIPTRGWAVRWAS